MVVILLARPPQPPQEVRGTLLPLRQEPPRRLRV
jgi:hypothetical protein